MRLRTNSLRSHTVIATVVWLLCATARAGAMEEGNASRSRFDHWMETHSEWLLGRDGLAANEKQRLGVTYAVMGSALAVLELGTRPPHEARWAGDNDFDAGIRDVLKGESGSARRSAETASDVLLGGLGVLLFLDEIWLRRENPVLKSLLFDGSWLLMNEVVTQTAKVAAGRERPYVGPCGDDSDYVSDCGEGRNRNASFFSAHTSTTATMAGLVCSRHLHRDGSGWPDWIACGGAAAASAVTGALRVTAEQHHATDVLAGWASGMLFGYVLPSHFDRRMRLDNRVLSLVPVEPVAAPEFVGVRLQYSF